MFPGAFPTTSGTTYRTLPARPLAATRTPTLLPDIAEYSPSASPTRTPSPARPTIRSVSVASFLSDGTIEIEGFGFDTLSEFGDDSSIFGDSLYDGSVYDGHDGTDDNRDISHRAEKILANAKRKLDLCGQNISRARSSLILSPSATPTSVVEHLDAVGPTKLRRAESAGGSHSYQWKYNNRAENEERAPAHLRTASESALQTQHAMGTGRSFGELRGLSNVMEEPRPQLERQPAKQPDRQPERQPERIATTMSRSNSAQYKEPEYTVGSRSRSNSTQYKEQARVMGSMSRSNSAQYKEPERVAGNMSRSNSAQYKEPERAAGNMSRSNSAQSRSNSAQERIPPGVGRSNSTQQMRVLRDQMKDLRGKITSLQEQTKTDSLKRRQSGSSLHSGETTPQWSPIAPTLEEIRESRELNIKGTIEQEWEKQEAAVTVRRASSEYSVDSDRSGTPTGPRREDVNSPTFNRPQYRSDAFSYDNYLFGDSFFQDIRPNSISSEGTASTATATHVGPAPLHVIERKTSMMSISSYATAEEGPNYSKPPSPMNDQKRINASLQASALDAPLRLGPHKDDGYHSAPHTPCADQGQTPTKPASTVPPSSWSRDSVATVSRHSIVETPDQHGGGVPLGIAGSTTDCEAMVVGGLGIKGKKEMELRIGRSDRILIEGVIEALGRVCCAMETEGEHSRNELRERLREAMSILDGHNDEMF